MEIVNSFEVPAPREKVWTYMLDVTKVVVCMPGASLTETIDDTHWKGKLTMKLGPVSLNFAGKVEMADGGTLFLDEIETMGPPMQVKLLRVLQEREVERLGGNRRVKVDMRVVAATNVDLKICLARGSLREDFYYRINVIPVQLPPLRERLEDLPILINYIMSKHPVAREKNIKQVAPKVLDQMLAYRWPGNIRELENILERAIVKCQSEMIEDVDLPVAPRRILDRQYIGVASGNGEFSLKQWLLRSEKEYLRSLLIKHKGAITLTAKDAKVDNKTLYRKMRRHGLHKESFKDMG